MAFRLKFLELAGIAVLGVATLAWAQDLSLSAAVDKANLEVSEPVKLTVTMSGDLSALTIEPFEFPEGLVVASRSQATSFSIRGGETERSMSLLYVLIPQRAGTFELGPFKIKQRHRTLQTDPIEITVQKPSVPPQLKKSEAPRYTL